MILGVPKEILNNETRVAVIPSTVKQLISAGFEVIIESGAGSLSQISDDDFLNVGAKIINNTSEVYNNSDMILKVNSPTDDELSMIKDNSSYLSFFQTMKEVEKVKILRKKYYWIFNAFNPKNDSSPENGCTKFSNKYSRLQGCINGGVPH